MSDYTMDKKEYILCAAIWYKELPTAQLNPTNVDVGTVLCGHRHAHVIYQLMAISGLRSVTNGPDSVGEYEQGFITSLNRFVDREEAGKIAFRANQTEKLCKYLFSENLY